VPYAFVNELLPLSTNAVRLMHGPAPGKSNTNASRVAPVHHSCTEPSPYGDHALPIDVVTTWYGLLHYANLIRRTGPYIVFLFNLLNLAMPLLSYVVRLVLLIFVPLSSLPCYLYDAVLILTSDILYSLIDTFLSILRYISTHVFVVEP
jgi:hypothetical protein